MAQVVCDAPLLGLIEECHAASQSWNGPALKSHAVRVAREAGWLVGVGDQSIPPLRYDICPEHRHLWDRAFG